MTEALWKIVKTEITIKKILSDCGVFTKILILWTFKKVTRGLVRSRTRG